MFGATAITLPCLSLTTVSESLTTIAAKLEVVKLNQN